MVIFILSTMALFLVLLLTPTLPTTKLVEYQLVKFFCRALKCQPLHPEITTIILYGYM